MTSRYDTIVIGAGLTGLITACQLAQAGQKVLVTATGLGAILLASGCIDVLGFNPSASSQPVNSPLNQLDDFLAAHPEHPYRFTGKTGLHHGIKAFLNLTANSRLQYQGNLDKNWLLPSTLGAVHPACLAPASFINGDLSRNEDMLIVGFNELKDFYPTLISQNINAQNFGFHAANLTLDLPEPLTGKVNITPIELAREFDHPEFRAKIVQAVKPHLKTAQRVGFPAVLGLSQSADVITYLQTQLAVPVFEISILPPSVPGRRLFDYLRQILVDTGTHFIVNSKVLSGTIQNNQVINVQLETARNPRTVTAQNFVLATGGIFGGGLLTDHLGKIWEPVFNLPVTGVQDRHQWFADSFLAPEGQPIARCGVKVNQTLNPINGSETPLATNLYLAGAVIAGYDWTHGRTGDGVALATSAVIVNQILNK